MFSLHDLLTRKLARQTGFGVEVADAKMSLLSGRFEIRDLSISNPSLFPQADFVEIPSVAGQVSLKSLWGGEVQLPELTVHIRRLTGVRAACGRINLAEFRAGLEGSGQGRVSDGARGGRLRVEKLHVRLDTVVIADLTGAEESREVALGIDERFQGVGDPLNLAPFFVESFAAAGLSQARNAIVAALLPELLWARVRTVLTPALSHWISPSSAETLPA
jgi:hypothetical protein